MKFESYKTYCFVLFISLLNILFSYSNAFTKTLSREAQDQLAPYLREGDEIVLLEAKASAAMMNIRNYHSPNSENISNDGADGHCFGLTQAQLALLNIEFVPGRKNDQEITQSILKAARGTPHQVIHGYTAEEFIREMSENFSKDGNPYRLAVEALQREHAVSLQADGSLRVTTKDSLHGGQIAPPRFSAQEMKAAQAQAKEFMDSIDKGIPIWASSFPIDQQSPVMSQMAKTGHAFMVVGYIKNKNFPTRLIVRNSNSPEKLTVIDSEKDQSGGIHWKDLDTRTASTHPVKVALGAQALPLEQQTTLQNQFIKTTSIPDENIAPQRMAAHFNTCKPGGSDFDGIFNHAAKSITH